MSRGAEADAYRSRASTTLRSSPALILPTAALTACSHSGADRLPSLQRTSAGGHAAGLRCGRAPAAAIVVSQATPPRRATLAAGPMRTEPAAAGSHVQLPK